MKKPERKNIPSHWVFSLSNMTMKDLVEVLPGRKYRMQCRGCGCTYILTASVDEERECDKPNKD